MLAYAQHFDMIEKSIIARGSGTMCRLSKLVRLINVTVCILQAL